MSSGGSCSRSLFLQGSPEPPAGVVFYPIFVLFEGYSVLRSSADAFVSGAFRRAPVASAR